MKTIENTISIIKFNIEKAKDVNRFYYVIGYLRCKQKYKIDCKPKSQMKLAKDIATIICEYHNKDVNSVLRPKNSKKFDYPTIRHIIVYFLEKYTELSVRDICEITIKKNHASYYHSMKTMKNWMQTNKKFSNKVDEIEKLIKIKIL